jgi:hypothetical protein
MSSSGGSPRPLAFSTRRTAALSAAKRTARLHQLRPASAHAEEARAVEGLSRVVARVGAGASTRACSLDLVRYVRAAPEPLALPPQGSAAAGNPWVLEVERGGAAQQACCAVA